MESGLKFTPTTTDSQRDFIDKFGTNLSSGGSKRLFDYTDLKDEHPKFTIAKTGVGLSETETVNKDKQP